jgi:hypothetical protein
MRSRYFANGDAIINTTLRNSRISQKKPNSNPKGQNRMSAISTKIPPQTRMVKNKPRLINAAASPIFLFTPNPTETQQQKKEIMN